LVKPLNLKELTEQLRMGAPALAGLGDDTLRPGEN